MHVTELLIHGVLRACNYDGDDCLGFFCLRDANSRENWFATSEPIKHKTQATIMYYVTSSLTCLCMCIQCWENYLLSSWSSSFLRIFVFEWFRSLNKNVYYTKKKPLKMTVCAQKLSFFLKQNRWNAKKQNWPYMTISCSPFPLLFLSAFSFFPTLICTASSVLRHIPYFVFSNLLRSLTFITQPVSMCSCVWNKCVLAYGWVYWTCLGKKHRKVSFTAKDPNGELWRFEECPDLKHTQAQNKNKLEECLSIMNPRLFKLFVRDVH